MFHYELIILNSISNVGKYRSSFVGRSEAVSCPDRSGVSLPAVGEM